VIARVPIIGILRCAEKAKELFIVAKRDRAFNVALLALPSPAGAKTVKNREIP